MNDILKMIGREAPIFTGDLDKFGSEIDAKIKQSKILVIGGAGSIGSEVVRQLFARSPRVLHVVDLSENNLAELVRSIRSTAGYIDGDFRTFSLDCLGPEFAAFTNHFDDYDYVLNFSALKHVRSEKDPFTLMRMLRTNIFGTTRTLEFAEKCNAKKYFCVSTDKASNPVNMMGASKRIMEMFLLRETDTPVSSARFANVAFSDGSLPASFKNRISKRQPIAAPCDVRRYFVTDTEGAILCLFSIFLGEDRDIFFPKLVPELNLETFENVAIRFLDSIGYEARRCESEDEARAIAAEGDFSKGWPCFFFASDTTGEKDFEEFFTENEDVDWEKFGEIGIVKNVHYASQQQLSAFENSVQQRLAAGQWDKQELVKLFHNVLDNFDHEEKNKSLDEKM